MTTMRLRILALATVVLGACSPTEILTVENPDIVNPGDLASPLAVGTLYAGTISDFRLAYTGNNGGQEGLLLVAGSLADELVNSETFPTRIEYDSRNIDLRNATLTAVFRSVQRARRSAEFAASTIAVALPETFRDDARWAEVNALAGYMYTFIGENYCSGVPISQATTPQDLEFGEPLTTTQLLERAVSFFDSALTTASSNATALRLARVGKARALLDLGRFNDAAALVTEANVPTSFTYNISSAFAPAGLQNAVFAFINQNERFSVADLDGTNGLNFRGARDPRVPYDRVPSNDVGFDRRTPQFDQGKYASETPPIPLATGVMARLMEAELKLRAGDASWLTILNTMRTNTSLYPTALPALPVGFTQLFPPLGLLTDPGTESSRVDLLFRERAFWNYLTNSRHGDLRRLVRQYSRDKDAVFPGGGAKPYIVNGNNKGGTFGNFYVLPVPFDEQNNPKFTQCLSLDP